MIRTVSAGSPVHVEAPCIDCESATTFAFCGGIALTIIFVLLLHHICKGKP